MYNLSGLYYQMKSNALVFGVAGICFLLISRFWTKGRKNIKNFWIGVFFLAFCICSVGYHIYIINHLEISIHEGFFIEEHRESPYLFRKEYCFSNEEGVKPLFELDIFSKKKIYPTEFKKGVKYKIYYETRKKIIVRVDEVE